MNCMIFCCPNNDVFDILTPDEMKSISSGLRTTRRKNILSWRSWTRCRIIFNRFAFLMTHVARMKCFLFHPGLKYSSFIVFCMTRMIFCCRNNDVFDILTPDEIKNISSGLRTTRRKNILSWDYF
jgi:hypothetical protein